MINIEEPLIMRLPELDCLKPSEHTTFRKLVEEISECNAAIDELKIYEEKHNSNYLLLGDDELFRIREEYKTNLNNVLGEIMDIAQVCASQLFVFEKTGVDVQGFFNKYMTNMSEQKIMFDTKNKCRYIYVAPTDNTVTLRSAMNMIILSMGKIAQLDKFTGENGEIPVMDEETSIERYVFELFAIIENCFNLSHSMESKYNINLKRLFDEHINKLIKKGYCTFENY